MSARGVNRVTLIGNVGGDPDVRFFPDGTPICTIRLATSETWKDKTTGEAKERTEWHNVVLRGPLAGIAQEHITKGEKLYIEGQIRTREWADANGAKRYTTEIHAREMQMLGSGTGKAAPTKPKTAPAKHEQRASQDFQRPAPPPDFDDDIPF